MTSGSTTGKPWDGTDLWRSNRLRETLSEAEEAEYDAWLDAQREADLEARRAELEDEFPEVDLNEPLSLDDVDRLIEEIGEENLDRIVDLQDDQDILNEARERAAAADEFSQQVSELEAPPDEMPAPEPEGEVGGPEFGPRRPLTPEERFEIGFSTTGLITPEMRAWEIAADAALSEQFGQRVVGQWVFGLSDPVLLSAGEDLPEGAEVIGPAGDDYDEGDRMIRIPTARRKYRIGEDGTFLGQFAYDDRQAASLLYVNFWQHEGTYNIPTASGFVVDVSTDRVFNARDSRAPKDVLDAVRADNDGGFWIDGDGDRPDPRWLAAVPKSTEEAMQVMAQRLATRGLVAEWVNDPTHVLNPTARAQRRGLFAPVDGWEPSAGAPTVEASPASDAMTDAVATAQSFFSGRMLIAAGIGVIVIGLLVAATLFSGGDDASDGVPASSSDGPASTSSDQAAGTTLDQPAPSTEARTPDGQVPELPAGWEAPPPFDRTATDADDPTVRWSSGGALWAWSVWQEPELVSELEEVDADFAVSQLTTIPAGTAIPNELVISVDCSSNPCTYSTVYGAVTSDFDGNAIDRRVTVPLVLSGLELTGSYVPVEAPDTTQVCTREGTYRLEVTDLTVINNRLVPDFIRGERTLQTVCDEYTLNETIEINGRYLFRGSYADQ